MHEIRGSSLHHMASYFLGFPTFHQLLLSVLCGRLSVFFNLTTLNVVVSFVCRRQFAVMTKNTAARPGTHVIHNSRSVFGILML